MKKVPLLMLVVTFLLAVGFAFAGTPVKGIQAKRSDRVLPAPAAPNAVLYDQYDNPGGSAWTSQDFEAAYDAFDNQAADDFVIPGGETWTIDGVDVQGVYSTGGPAAAFNVFIYADAGGLPGAAVFTGLNQTFTDNGADFVITLSPAAVLTSGTYWVSVQARQDFGTAGQWFWNDRSVQAGNPAAWQNPGGGFGVGCTTWGVRGTCIGGTPDHMFRLNGTIGAPCVYSNDFNDGVLEWTEEKATVTESGGFLNLTPLKRKAIATADAAFGAQSVGTYTYVIEFTGGPFSKNWLYISRTDKKNQLEVLAKVDTGKLVVKDRLFAVAAKAKADFTWVPGTTYTIDINYDGTNVDVSVDGTPIIVDFVPSRVLPAANTGAAAKLNTMMIDSFCFN